MAVTIATPAQIGGALGTDEVLVLHVKGAYAGMTLVNKSDDSTLGAAATAGEIVVQDGWHAPTTLAGAQASVPGGTSSVAGGTSTVAGGTSTVASSDAPGDTI